MELIINSAPTEAKAAPFAPITGIKTKFNIKLTTVPVMIHVVNFFSFPHASRVPVPNNPLNPIRNNSTLNICSNPTASSNPFPRKSGMNMGAAKVTPTIVGKVIKNIK